MKFVHTLPSGNVISAVLSPPGAAPVIVLGGEPAEDEQDELDLWLDTVVLPALAEQTLKHLTGVEPDEV
jgi:hypothetical protein